ncbi:MAG: hypothetical protein ACJAW3_000407 [Lentimonas sp.]|jgi:hypothetical protein
MTHYNLQVSEVKNGKITPELTKKNSWQKVTHIYVLNSPNLQSLHANDLPNNLIYLGLGKCLNLTYLESLPPKIKILDLNNCSKLQYLTIGKLKNLETINLNGCDGLEFSDQLIEDLKRLETSGCKITYPKKQQIIREKAIQETLSKVEELKNSSPNLHLMLSRYLTEDLDRRDSRYILAQNVNVLFLHLEGISTAEKGFDLDLFEEIATNSLAGCVNQPTLGVIKINTTIEALKLSTLKNQIVALRPLIILNILNHFVKFDNLRNSTAKIPPILAAEIVLVLAKEVQNKLLQDGKMESRWPAFPSKIANEENQHIKKFINDSIIYESFNLVVKVLTKSTLQEQDLAADELMIPILGHILAPQESRDAKSLHKEMSQKILQMPQNKMTGSFRELNAQKDNTIYRAIVKSIEPSSKMSPLTTTKKSLLEQNHQLLSG